VAHWVLAIATVIVAAIAAGHPGSADPWPPEKISEWTTATAILAGLSGLLPWRTTALGYGRAHEKLRDAIMVYDGDITFTVQYVLDAAHEAAAELNLVQVIKSGERKG